MSIITQTPIVPSGTQNGINAVFTLPAAPAPPGSLTLFFNGMYLYQGIDYTLTGQSITLAVYRPNSANVPPDVLVATYTFNSSPAPAGTPSADDIIYMALRKVGQMRPGYIASPELRNDCLLQWQTMFDEMGSERGMQYSNPVYEYPITGPGSQTNGNGYQIGPSAADWVGPRPEVIIRANLVLTNQGPQPVYIQLQPVSQQEWAALSIQQIPSSTITNIFWYDPQYPNGVFNVFPPINQNSIQIYQSGVLQAPTALTDPYNMPPGYQDLVIQGLAERIYYMVPREAVVRVVPFGILSAQAEAARTRVRRINKIQPKLASDFPGGRRPAGFYDSFVTYTGEPY